MKHLKLFESFVPDSANHPMLKVGTKIDVINPDFFEGDEKEEGCEIVSIKPTRGLSPEIIVKLASDPSIRCKVEWQHGRWVILENVYESSTDSTDALDVSSAKAFNASLKKAVAQELGMSLSDVKVSIINSYKFPKCYVQVFVEGGFPNEFRLKVADAIGARKNLIDDKDVSYGNIQKNRISIHVPEWQAIFKK